VKPVLVDERVGAAVDAGVVSHRPVHAGPEDARAGIRLVTDGHAARKARS
jgi:hypothetical protein